MVDGGRSTRFFLTSERLAFREWSLEDLPLAMELWGDPAVTSRIGGPFSPEAVAERLAREIACVAAHGVQYWPVFLALSGTFAGCCGLRPWRPEEKILEIGVHLVPAQWGKGLATEAADAVIRYAFETLGVSGLFAGHHPENHASATLLRRLGFRFTHHERYDPTGLMHPSYLLRPGEYRRPGR